MSQVVIEPMSDAHSTPTTKPNTHPMDLTTVQSSSSDKQGSTTTSDHQRSSSTTTTTPPQQEETILQVILLGDRNHNIKPAILSTQLLPQETSMMTISENGNNTSSCSNDCIESNGVGEQQQQLRSKTDSPNSTRHYHHHRGSFQVLGSAGEPNRANSSTSLDSNCSSASSTTDSVEAFSPPSNGLPQVGSPKSLPTMMTQQHNNPYNSSKFISTLTMNFNPNAPSGNAVLLLSQKQNLFDSVISKKSTSLPEFSSHLHSDNSSTGTDYDELSGSELSGYNDLYIVRNVNTVNIEDLIQCKEGNTNMLDSDLVFLEHLKKVRTRYQSISDRLIESENFYGGSDEMGGSLSNSPQLLTPQMVRTPPTMNAQDEASSQQATAQTFTFSSLEAFTQSFNATCIEYCQEELKFLYSIMSPSLESVKNETTTANHSPSSTIPSNSTPLQSLPIYISWNSLNIDELKCSCNVLKKISVLQHDFTLTEKMFIAQNLALPDCFNYMLFDNPTRSLIEQNKAIGRYKMNYSIDSDASSPETSPSTHEKKKKRFNWFGGSKKKQQQQLSNAVGRGGGNPITDKSMYLQVYIVLLEVADSRLIQIPSGFEHNVFRSAIAIGNWLLEWNEYSLIVPSRKSPHGTRLNHNYHYIPLRKIEGENVEKALIKLSNLCCLWNGNFVYDLKNCNHQHFVRDVLELLESENLFSPLPVTATQASFVPPLPPVGITNPTGNLASSSPIHIGNSHRDHGNTPEIPIRLFGTSVEMFLHRIQRDGYSSIAFYTNEEVKEVLYGKKKKTSSSTPTKTNNHGMGSSPTKSTMAGIVASPPQSATSTRASIISTATTFSNTTVTSTSSSPGVMTAGSSMVCDMPPSPQLSYINKNGTNATIFNWNEKDFITFKEHRDVDNLYFQIKSAFGQGNYYFNSFEGQWDRWLLQLFDRSFWVRVTQSKKPVDRNSKDYPLTKQNARLTLHKESLEQLSQSKHVVTQKGNVLVHCKEEINCPFNPEALSTIEIDMMSKLADSSSLGDYEPSVPYRRNWISTFNLTTNNQQQ